MNCSSSTHEQWAALFRSGLTQKEIALRFGTIGLPLALLVFVCMGVFS